MRNLKQLLLNSTLLLATLVSMGWAGQKSSGDGIFVLTKDLVGATGSATMSSQNYSLAFAWGEPVSGNVISSAPYTLVSGYIGGHFGSAQTMKLLSSRVGASDRRTFFQDRVQIGVPFDAPVELTLSDPIFEGSLSQGVQVTAVLNHLGQAANSSFAVTITTDNVNHKITLLPQGSWLGNTLYDIQLTPSLLSDEGFPLDKEYHVYFVTMLDHRQENVVLEPMIPAALAADAAPLSAGVMAIQIPSESLSGFSTVLLSRDPVAAPLRVDPKIIQEANDKARAAGGPYRVPLAIQEIGAYNASGTLMGPLSKAAQITFTYGGGAAAPAAADLVRPQTLSIWVLDETHKLWIKMPASQNSSANRTVSAPVATFSVFALMGSADATTSDTFVFPVPWRPHGPHAGTDQGQTGTEASGITFANIPPECTIKIYTIAGDLVRSIHHSDTGGTPTEETWDVKTTNGDSVASGVYLWRVESAIDGKNGKLMVIR